MKRKMHKLPKLSTLREKAWKGQSEYSRRKDADKDGYVSCVTCGVTKHWKELHAGHFFHGSKQRPISYDDRNIHAQCNSCNTYKGGARDHYSAYIIKRYGPNAVLELLELKHQGKEMRRPELEEVIALNESRIEHLNRRAA